MYMAWLQKSYPSQKRKKNYSSLFLLEFWSIEFYEQNGMTVLYYFGGVHMLFDVFRTSTLQGTGQRERQTVLYVFRPPFTLHTSFSDHLGAGGVQLTLLPLSPYA